MPSKPNCAPGRYGGALQSKSGSPRSAADHMARKAQHMSQREVAADFGKHQSTVSRAAMRDGFTGGGKARD
jgi:transposase